MNLDSNPDTRVSLIAKLRDTSDDDAWSEFVQIYQPVVQRFIQKHGLQYADAAEITQEVLSKVARSIETWKPEQENATFRGWLYRLTRNQTIDFLRRRKSDRQSQMQDAGLSQVAIPNSDSEAEKEFRQEFEQQLFHWAADKLRPQFKPTNWQAFWLSTVEGKSVNEVAEALDIECSTIYVARSRIMARLSALIQQRLNETTSLPK